MKSSTFPGGGVLGLESSTSCSSGGSEIRVTRKGRQRGILVVLRIEQEQFGLRQVDVGEAEVEFRFEFALEQGAHLVGDGLPLFHRLLGDGQDRLRLKSVVKGLINGEQDLFFRGQRVLVLCLGGQVGAGDEVGGASEIGEELADHRSGCSALVDDRIVQGAGRDARAGIGIDRGEIHRRGRPETRPNLPRYLQRRQCAEARDGDLRVVL